MDELLRDLARRVETADGFPFERVDDPMHVLWTQNVGCVLFATPLPRPTGTISHAGDLFVGLYNDSDHDLTVTVDVGGRTASTYVLRSMRFAYAMDDASVVPLLNLRYHEVIVRHDAEVRPTSCVKVLYATLRSSALRRQLAMRGAYARREPELGGGFFAYSSGMGGACATLGLPKNAVRLPNMRHVPIVFDDLLSEDAVADLLRLTDDAKDSPPVLQERPAVFARVKRELARLVAEEGATEWATAGHKIVGERVAVGCTDAGMHEHRDESYQEGGDATLLLYLTTVAPGAGGETEFTDCGLSVRAVAGRGVVFDARAMHRANAVTGGGTKRIVAFELSARKK